MTTLTRTQVREIDRRAIEEYGMPGVVLMENAGRGAAEILARLNTPDPKAASGIEGRGDAGSPPARKDDGFILGRLDR